MNGPSVVQSVANGTVSGAGYSLALPASPTAGNLLVLILATGPTEPTITPSFGTAVTSNLATSPYFQIYTKVSDGTETSVGINNPGSYWVSGVLVEVTGQDPTTPINAVGTPVTATLPFPNNNVPAFGPVSSTVANCLALAGCNFDSTVNSFASSSGWTNVNALTGVNNHGVMLVAQQTAATPASLSGTFTINTNSGSSVGTCTDVLIIQPASAGGSTGTLNATLDPATLSATGTVGTHGTLAATLGALVLAAAGAVGVNGSAGVTLDPATLVAAGAVPVTGSLSATLGDATLSASGTVVNGITGSLNATLDPVTASAAGTLSVNGSLASTLDPASLSSTGTVAVSGTLAQTLGAVTLIATGTSTPGIHGSLTATLGAVTLSSAGTVATHGSLTQALGAASLLSNGTVHVTGSAANTLGGVTLTAAGNVPVSGFASITLANATLVATGTTGTTTALQPDANYLVRMTPRPFYASLSPRPFYAQLRARTFYALSDPDMTPKFDTKDPRETVVLTFDGSVGVAAGETLIAITNVSVTVISGIDANANTVVSSQAINAQPVTVNGITIPISGGVQAVATGGLTGCVYLIAITCTTSNPEKVLVLKGALPVSSQ